MRLLNVANILELKEFIGSGVPPYAILSHTWEDDEITLQQMKDPASALKKGYRKIQQTCALAARDGLGFAWVDTCCIDKLSSAELTEAINSMFQWYENAKVCYVFLADLAPGDDLVSALGKCRWFSRGWTLQELIAPRNIAFFDSEWAYRGSKSDLGDLIASITGIPESILSHQARLSDFAVARRMSWAAHRQTTRVEDMAYCLLGIFDVNMSLIYGEGMKAFYRLQEAIVRNMADLSIFAWTDGRVPCPQFAGILAESPRQFESCRDIQVVFEDSIYRDFIITTRGIQVEANVRCHAHNPAYKAVLNIFCKVDGALVGVCLRKIGGSLYARLNPATLAVINKDLKSTVEPLTLATRIQDRFPFHPGNHPVLGNRYSALRFSWVERSPGFEVTEYRAFPRSHWDSHDAVFFGSNSVSNGWGAFFLYGTLTTSAVRIQLSFFLACFKWNTGPPRVVIASLSSFDSANIVFLEHLLEKIKFESSVQAEKLVRQAFGHNLGERSVTVEATLPTDRRGAKGDSETAKYKETATVTISLGQELCYEVCVNPITRVDIVVRANS